MLVMHVIRAVALGRVRNTESGDGHPSWTDDFRALEMRSRVERHDHGEDDAE